MILSQKKKLEQGDPKISHPLQNHWKPKEIRTCSGKPTVFLARLVHAKTPWGPNPPPHRLRLGIDSHLSLLELGLTSWGVVLNFWGALC